MPSFRIPPYGPVPLCVRLVAILPLYTCSRDLTVLPALRIPRSSAKGMNTCLCLPSRSWYPEGWKAELALGGWLVTYRNKCPAPGIKPDTVTHLSTNRAQRRLTSLIEANALTTTPDHQTVC